MGKKRWVIAVLLSFGVIVNYLDRTNLSVAGGLIASEFHLSPGQMGILFSSFVWTYAFLQIPVGALLDKIGVKWVIRVATLIWTVATLMTALVSGMGLILISRLLLGSAEAPFFPANAKAVGYWFPRNERSRAIALFDAESKLANALGVAFVSIVVAKWGWRGGFYMTCILSLVYMIAFWIIYRDPQEDKRLSGEEYNYIKQGGAQSEGEAVGSFMSNLRYLLTFRKVWGVIIGYSAYGYTWYLFLTWLPSYLAKEMHMSLLTSGWYASIPWLVGAITELIIGGWLIDHLVNKGYDPMRVRKIFLVICMTLGLAVAGAAFTTNPKIAVVYISISLGSLVITSSIAFSVTTFIAPKGTVGTLMGLLTFGNSFMGILAPIVTGFIVGATGTFAAAFVVAAIILFIGILSYVFLLTDLDPIPSQDKSDQLGKKPPFSINKSL